VLLEYATVVTMYTTQDSEPCVWIYYKGCMFNCTLVQAPSATLNTIFKYKRNRSTNVFLVICSTVIYMVYTLHIS